MHREKRNHISLFYVCICESGWHLIIEESDMNEVTYSLSCFEV